MTVFFEDKYLIIAYKEPGVASQADPSGRADMVSLLRERGGGDVFCVHRLDTATGGIMVFAKDSRTAGRLMEVLSSDSALKQYMCVVRGSISGCGSMTDLLYHDKRKNKAYVVDRKRAGVKEALLDYEALCEKDGLSLVRVTLHTGRTHQIRVQFASRRLPLLGDGKYGSKDNCPLALRCIRLAFDHPYTKRRLDYTSLPESPWHTFDI